MYAEQTITVQTDDTTNPVVRLTYHPSGIIVRRGFIENNALHTRLVEVLFFRLHPELTVLFDVMDGWKREKVEMMVSGWDWYSNPDVYPVRAGVS